MRHVLVILRAALADYLHEGRLSLVAVMGLMAVLAPLLVLFGLKHGVVSSLIHELESDPLSRQLQPIGQGRYQADWLQALGTREDVSFVVPATRFLAATIEARAEDRRLEDLKRLEMRSTAAGDPLWNGPVPETSHKSGLIQAVLSASAADQLGVGVGDRLDGRLGRVVGGRQQRVRLTIEVLGIIPRHLEARSVALVAPEFLESTEDYREGVQVPEWGWSGRRIDREERSYASFRLYARTIHDVEELRRHLAAQGVDVDTAAAQIETVLDLNRALVVLFGIVAILAAGGYAVSMTLGLIAAVARKQKELSILKTLGFPSGAIALFPVFQSLVTAGLGGAAALGLYFVAEPVINGLFDGVLGSGLVVCAIEPRHAAIAWGATIALSFLTSLAAGMRAGSVDAAEGLRNE